MKRLRDLNVPQEENETLFPDGQIKNETASAPGTPVVREVYGDILTNIYAIIRNAGLSFNGLEDNENNGYQFLKSLKVFFNELNDLRQGAIVSPGIIRLNINLDNLPDEYVILCRPDNFISINGNYNLQGLGSETFNIVANQDISSGESFVLIFKGVNTEFVKIQSEQNMIQQDPPSNGTFFINLRRNAGVDYTGSTTSITDIQEGSGSVLGGFAKVKGNWAVKPVLSFATESDNSLFTANEIKYLYFEVWADGIIYWFANN